MDVVCYEVILGLLLSVFLFLGGGTVAEWQSLQHTNSNTFTHRLAHTVNGTACATPRLIIALCETFQESDGTITLPEVLHPYLMGGPRITPPTNPCRTTWLKHKAFQGLIVPAGAGS